IGVNATGQTLVIHGQDLLPSDSTVRFDPPNSSAGSISAGTPTVSADGTTVTVPNVNTTGVTGLGTWNVEVDSPATYKAQSNFLPLTVDADPTATNVTYVNSTRKTNSPNPPPQQVDQYLYGQGAHQVHLQITAGGTFVGGSGAADTHTHA